MWLKTSARRSRASSRSMSGDGWKVGAVMERKGQVIACLRRVWRARDFAVGRKGSCLRRAPKPRLLRVFSIGRAALLLRLPPPHACRNYAHPDCGRPPGAWSGFGPVAGRAFGRAGAGAGDALQGRPPGDARLEVGKGATAGWKWRRHPAAGRRSGGLHGQCVAGAGGEKRDGGTHHPSRGMGIFNAEAQRRRGRRVTEPWRT